MWPLVTEVPLKEKESEAREELETVAPEAEEGSDK